MSRTIRAIIAAVLVMVIAFCAISIFQDVGKSLKVDVTDQRIYTLSNGTKAILSRINQPLTMKLYYAKTAALQGPDQIQFFNNYYYFVRALLEEYVADSKGMIKLEVIDPRPFSDDEVEALRLGLKRFAITEEESFFFGLVLQTPFGVEKTIPFFSPDRQNFVEYDISYLIDTAITRQKRKIGVLSSLPVMGQDTSGYMAQMMRAQGREPQGPWVIIDQLRKQYEVTSVPTDTNDINDVDILMVIHPKGLSDQTLFAVDQFILKGGRAIICVDPHCIVDKPAQSPGQMQMPQSQGSELNKFLHTWGLDMPKNTFAGDRALAIKAAVSRDQRPEPIIGYLDLNKPECFSQDSSITSRLNEVRVLFAGVLNKYTDAKADPNKPSDVQLTPLLSTTNRGNSWSTSGPWELAYPNPERLMEKFVDGDKPVHMGYLITGKLDSSFPNGIEVEYNDPNSPDPNKPIKLKRSVKGLTKAAKDCAVVVYSDVDFITDGIAYQDSFFGKMVVADNAALMLNTVEDLSGSSDLISIRSRGNFRRPFTVVDKIEEQADAETSEEVARLNSEIQDFTSKIQKILTSSNQGKTELVGSSILQQQRDLETKKRQAQVQLNKVRLHRREKIELLGNKLRNFDTLLIPGIIALIAVVLLIYRSGRRRHYISHTSDA